MTAHKHWFTSLWPSNGRDATFHYHPCIVDMRNGENCPWIVIGSGRSCTKSSRHERRNLDRVPLTTPLKASSPESASVPARGGSGGSR